MTEAFVAANLGNQLCACSTLPALVQSLALPRKLMLMVKAGAAVDEVLAQLIPLLSAGDILIDGGNSKCMTRSTPARSQATPRAWT